MGRPARVLWAGWAGWAGVASVATLEAAAPPTRF